MRTSQEIAVPLTVANTGGRSWDPARIKLSYHWLWIVPRELAHRSRTVPYHDGIRTELTAPVAAGGALPVQARILAPSFPGVYWLQWDMVEEGAVWFAQVAPRQPRRLVVVLPPAAVWFAPLPFVFAVAGIAILDRLGRGRRTGSLLTAFGATADVWWCAAVLLSKPFILAGEVLLEPTAVADWLTIAIAVLVPLALMLVLPRRLRAWTLLAVGTFGTALILGDVIYYRFFGDILSAPALIGARQTGQVWGSIRTLFSAGLVWLLLDVPFALWMTVKLTSRGAPAVSARGRAVVAAAGAAVVLALGLFVSAPRVLASIQLEQMFRDRAVAEELSPLGYHGYDAWSYARSTLFRPRASAAQTEAARAWFADRASLRSAAGPDGGVAAGRNLIVIQVESLQDFVVDYRVSGEEVMPHLRRWVDDGLRFTHVTDETSEGRTSDAEFAAFTSLLPLDHGAVAFRYPGNHYVGLPRVLVDHGYHTLSAVPFEAGFWNRAVMHPSYGFQHSLFEPDFDLTEQIGWGLNDHDFLQQMVPRLERLPRPFAAWLITLSLHHPFDGFPARHKKLKLGALEDTPFGNYLHAMHFFDRALADFRDALARKGMLEDSLIVVFGDHDAGFQRDAGLARKIGTTPTDAGWALADRVPLFIRVPHRADGRSIPNGPRAIAAGQTDFAPTILALLGIDAAPLPYIGRNLLGAPGDSPVLRPYGDWLDAGHLFLAASATGPACVDVPARVGVPRSACSSADARARTARDISRLVVIDDMQQALRDIMGR
jgi:phosphoglycerol transferase MdoB-like AlkP superfamily enzyme